MFCFFDILYRIGDINDIKTTKPLSKIPSLFWWIMHQSFVTTAPTTYTHKREIAGTTAFHPSQPWDLLRVIDLLFIIINSTGYIYIILLARHLPGTAGEPKKPMSRRLAALSPAHPRRCVCGGGVGVSGYKCLVHYESSCLSSGSKKMVISSQCELDVSIISGKPEVHPIISLR